MLLRSTLAEMLDCGQAEKLRDKDILPPNVFGEAGLTCHVTRRELEGATTGQCRRGNSLGN